MLLATSSSFTFWQYTEFGVSYINAYYFPHRCDVVERCRHCNINKTNLVLPGCKFQNRQKCSFLGHPQWDRKIINLLLSSWSVRRMKSTGQSDQASKMKSMGLSQKLSDFFSHIFLFFSLFHILMFFPFAFFVLLHSLLSLAKSNQLSLPHRP